MPEQQANDDRISSGRGRQEGNEPESLAQAIRMAVHAANQPEGTTLKVEIYVESVGDPDVGAYKVIVTPI